MVVCVVSSNCWGSKAFVQLSIRHYQRACAASWLLNKHGHDRPVSISYYCSQRRSFFSTAKAHNNNIDKTDVITPETEPGKLLYQRSKNRFNFPMYLTAFSTCQMGYWLWYVTEFTAAVAAKTDFEVNYYLGGVGLGLSVIMVVGSCAYPRLLISEIRDLGKGVVSIKNLTAPFATVDKVGTTYTAGSLKVDDVDKEHIIKKGSIANYRNHLAITRSNSRFPLLLSPSQDDFLREANLVSLLIPGSLSAREKTALNGDKKKVTRQRKAYARIPNSTRQLPRIGHKI
jgi:hypothetical protein